MVWFFAFGSNGRIKTFSLGSFFSVRGVRGEPPFLAKEKGAPLVVFLLSAPYALATPLCLAALATDRATAGPTRGSKARGRI